MKKFILGLTAVLLLTSTAFGQEKDIVFYKNFEKVETTAPLVEKNDTVYIGLRDFLSITRSDDAPIDWLESTKSASVDKGGYYITAGSCVIKVSGKDSLAEAPAEIIDDRLMIPVDMAELMSRSTIDYDSESGSLDYIAPEYVYANGESGYRVNRIKVDLKNKKTYELDLELKDLLKRSGTLKDTDTLSLVSVEVGSEEGSGTVIYRVDGEISRNLTVYVKNNTVLKIADELPIITR